MQAIFFEKSCKNWAILKLNKEVKKQTENLKTVTIFFDIFQQIFKQRNYKFSKNYSKDRIFMKRLFRRQSISTHIHVKVFDNFCFSNSQHFNSGKFTVDISLKTSFHPFKFQFRRYSLKKWSIRALFSRQIKTCPGI